MRQDDAYILQNYRISLPNADVRANAEDDDYDYLLGADQVSIEG